MSESLPVVCTGQETFDLCSVDLEVFQLYL